MRKLIVALSAAAGLLLMGAPDLAHETTWGGLDYIPWVNGADRSFSHPLVLTVDPGTRHPQKQLKIERENLLTGGVTRDSQEFTSAPGPAA